MANNIVTITVTDSSKPIGSLKEIFTSDNPSLGLNNMSQYLVGIASGYNYSVSVASKMNNGNAVQATGVCTLGSSGVSTATQVGDILLLNGTAFTAVASGAAGNQYNVGANDGATATNLAAAINASVTAGVTGKFTAAAASNVVTVSSVNYGTLGNDYDLEARGSGALVVTGQGNQASGTLTFNNAGIAGDTFTINGVTFTAVSSGATGNQWNVGGSATLSAAAASAAINASVTAGVLNFVYTSAAAGVITLKADRAGIFGNEFTITGGQASITASGARLTGGTDSAVVNMTGGVDDTSAVKYTY